jgi:hypothetical protein
MPPESLSDSKVILKGLATVSHGIPVSGSSRANDDAEAMSALPPIADMCGATRDVRFLPIATFRDLWLSSGNLWLTAISRVWLGVRRGIHR